MKKETFLEHLKPFINTDCGSYQPAGVGKIADMLTEKYTALGGWHIKRQHLHDEVGPGLLISHETADGDGSPQQFWLSADDDGHPHTENLEQFSTK